MSVIKKLELARKRHRRFLKRCSAEFSTDAKCIEEYVEMLLRWSLHKNRKPLVGNQVVGEDKSNEYDVPEKILIDSQKKISRILSSFSLSDSESSRRFHR